MDAAIDQRWVAAVRRGAATLAALALVLALAVASASSQEPPVPLADGDDTRSALDLRAVNATYAGADLTFTIATYGRWPRLAMVDRGFFAVHLDPGTGQRYFALVRFTRRRTLAILFRKEGTRGVRLSRLRVRRSDRASVSVWIPAQRLGLTTPGQAYAWRVQSLWTGRKCKRVCLDRAPDAADATATVPPAAPPPPPAP